MVLRILLRRPKPEHNPNIGFGLNRLAIEQRRLESPLPNSLGGRRCKHCGPAHHGNVFHVSIRTYRQMELNRALDVPCRRVFWVFRLNAIIDRAHL